MFCLLVALWSRSLHAVDLSNIPLDPQVISPLPNLVAMVDNSAVMDAEILVPATDGRFQGKAYIFPRHAYSPAVVNALGPDAELSPSQRRDWRLQWHGYNSVYYNPDISYLPWPDTQQYRFHPADRQSPRANPIAAMDGNARLDLAGSFFTVVTHHEAIVVPNAHYFTLVDINGNGIRDPDETVYLTIWVDVDGDGKLEVSDDSGNDLRRYFRFEDDGDGLIEDDELVRLMDEDVCNRIRPAFHHPRGKALRFKTDLEDLQNFANWVTYYRRRILAVKGQAARVIARMKDVSTGLFPLNSPGQSVIQSMTDNPVIVDNRDGNFSTLGAWYTFNSSHAWGGTSVYSDQEGAVAVFRPDLPTDGSYEVSAWWPCGGVDMGTARIQFCLNQQGSTFIKSVDQSEQGPNDCGRWVSLGTWDFPGGGESTVQFICPRDGAWILADALRFYRLQGEADDNHVTDELLNRIYTLSANGGKNLRAALNRIGRYFHRHLTSAVGPSPLASEEAGGGCQQNLALMVSDGIWNGSFFGVGNADGNQGPAYADPWSDTLADVAMYYYTLDLAPGLPDQVPAMGDDHVSHQHMSTYGIVLGGRNMIDADGLNGDGQTGENSCWCDPGASRPQWPQPTAGHRTCVDDFRHAAINGRGEYYFPYLSGKHWDGGFMNRISRLATAVRSEQFIGEAATDDTLLEDDTVIYQTRYYAGAWTGDVVALRDNGEDEVLWSAAQRMDQDRANPDTRRIITYSGHGADPLGRPFRYEALSDLQKKMLGSDLRTGSEADNQAAALLDFLRGDEDGPFRRREGPLGDIVNSAPLVVGETVYVGANDGMLHAFDTNNGTERFAYVPHGIFAGLMELGTCDYSLAHRFYVDGTPTAGDVQVDPSQRLTLLVGGYGKGGRGYYCLIIRRQTRAQNGEEFGPYEDDFNVDAFGSDATEQEIGNIVKWEYPRPDTADDGMDNDQDGLTDELGEYDPDIGYSVGQGYAVLANVAGDGLFRPVVIFSNGYNSAGGRAVLYILDALSGKLVRKIDTGAGGDNGLSIPALIDVDADRCIDYAYAGDLKGNLWKFDLTAGVPAMWGVAYGVDQNHNGVIDASDGDTPMPVFWAAGQAITARPDVMFAQSACAPQANGNMVVFGTGRYLGLSDRSDSSQQSIFGIWDYGDDSDDSEFLGTLTDRTSGVLSNGLILVPQEVGAQITTDGMVQRRISSDHPVDYSMVEDTLDGDGYSANDLGRDQQPNPLRHAGWFFDFPSTPEPNAGAGERVISNVTIRNGSAVVISYVPESRPCRTGASAWLYLVDGCFSGDALDQQDDSDGDLSLRILSARRFDHRLTSQVMVIKESRTLPLDRLLISDPSGGMSHLTFPGEVWGKVYWRQNLQ